MAWPGATPQVSGGPVPPVVVEVPVPVEVPVEVVRVVEVPVEVEVVKTVVRKVVERVVVEVPSERIVRVVEKPMARRPVRPSTMALVEGLGERAGLPEFGLATERFLDVNGWSPASLKLLVDVLAGALGAAACGDIPGRWDLPGWLAPPA